VVALKGKKRVPKQGCAKAKSNGDDPGDLLRLIGGNFSGVQANELELEKQTERSGKRRATSMWVLRRKTGLEGRGGRVPWSVTHVGVKPGG